MFNEETTAGIALSQDAEEIVGFVRFFFQIMTALVGAIKELYAYFFGE